MPTTHAMPSPRATSPPATSSHRLNWLPTAWFWMLIPAVVYLGVITLWPMIDSIYISFTDMGTSGSGSWVGFDNYLRGFGDSVYWHSVGVTCVFMVCSVALETIAAWIIALLLWAPASTLTNWARTLFAIPMMKCPVVVGITWRSLLNPQFGWINALFNMPGMDWLGNANYALWMLVAVDAWQWTPFLFLIISGGLLSLPGEVMEAARVDGAGPVRRFWSVVLPLMMPVTLVGVLLRALDASKTFDLVYNLTTGGPGNATETAAMFIYRRAFQDFDQGYAAALSVITAVLLTSGLLPDGTFRFHDKKTGKPIGGHRVLGTFSEFAIVSENSCVKIDADIPLEVGALVSCGVLSGWGSAVYAARARPGDTVMIIGAGGLGINAVQGARHAGATYIIAVDPVMKKLDVAKAMGATHACKSMEEGTQCARDLNPTAAGADATIVCTGNVSAETVTAAFEATGKGGALILTGLSHDFNEINVKLPGSMITVGEKRIQGCLMGSCNPFRDVPLLLELYRAGKLKLDELVSQRYNLNEINKGFADLRAGRNMRGVIEHHPAAA